MSRVLNGSTNNQSLFSTGLSWPGNFPITMAAWGRYEGGAGANDHNLMQFQDSTSDQAYYRIGRDQTTANRVHLVLNDGVTFQEAVSSAAFTTGEWFHCCGVFAAGNDLTIYLDGGNTGTDTTTGPTITGINSVAIGREMDTSPGDSWDGAIGPCTAWSVALTAAEVLALAQGVHPFKIQPDKIFFHCEMTSNNTSEGNGGREYDVIGGLLLDNYSSPVGPTAGTGTIGTEENPPIMLPYGAGRFVIPAAGGTTHNVSLSFALQAGKTPTNVAIMAAGLSFALQAGDTPANTASMAAAMIMPVQVADTKTASMIGVASAAFGAQLNEAIASQAAFVPSLTLGTDFSLNLSGGLLVAEAVTFALTSGQSQDAIITIEGSLALAAQFSEQTSSTAAMSAQLALNAQLAMTSIVQGILNAGLTLSCIKSVSMNGTKLVTGIVTPAGRTITVVAETRQTSVPADTGNITIQPD